MLYLLFSLIHKPDMWLYSLRYQSVFFWSCTKMYSKSEIRGETFRGHKSKIIKKRVQAAFSHRNVHGSIPLNLKWTPKRQKNKYFTLCLRAIHHSHTNAAKSNAVRAIIWKKCCDQRIKSIYRCVLSTIAGGEAGVPAKLLQWVTPRKP